MTTVELVLTDTRVWAVGPRTHWDGPPSVVLGGAGGLVVGEPLTPPTQVSSAVQYVSADRIALAPRIPTAVEALAAVADAVLDKLGLAAPVARMTVIVPTEWGGHRRAVVVEALRRVAAEVVFEDTAIRAVAADGAAARGRRAVVLEFGALTTTASSVAPGPSGLRLESCEFAPDLAAVSLGVEPDAARSLADLLGGLLSGRPVDVVQVFGLADPVALEAVRAEVRGICGPETAVRPISGTDLVRPSQPESELGATTAALPSNEWLQPLRERAAAQRDPRDRRAVYLLGGVAAAIAIVIGVVSTVIALGGSDDSEAAAPAASSASVAGAESTAPAPAEPGPSAAPSPESFGRIRFQMPDGWKSAPASAASRLDLAPADGARMRIILTQNTVAPDAGYEQIAANLESQMRQRPAIGDLRRDVVFGGRSMLAYTERPEGGSTVDWHVLVEHGTQVSIGCQYTGDGWRTLASTCDRFAASVHVMP
ncbi:type VII secretion-associated protein [Nocardia bovistercoris]|uniref:Type VII secretion-associated protein n=1 Tax=Nocardia bovistercoris TaxID=2785916 RepID=A0A931IAR0_9NOCA|nr:type VII secretion-associated protein [Nocardia bovistercoris]MBH0777551.1 type VII secretion-associated protein [Nocardia bovistercoris]